MNRTWRYAVTILIAAGVLAVLSSVAIDQIGRRWFLRDVEQRAELVWRSVSAALADDVTKGRTRTIATVLDAITKDETVAAAGICMPNGRLIRSARYPVDLSCTALYDDHASGVRQTRCV